MEKFLHFSIAVSDRFHTDEAFRSTKCSTLTSTARILFPSLCSLCAFL